MNCEATQLQIGADPQASNDVLEAHLLSCARCTAFQRETRALDGQIRRALELPLEPLRPAWNGVELRRPAAQSAGAAVSRRLGRSRAWALAASVALAVTIGLVFWSTQSQPALATAVVEHMALEPDSWNQRAPVPQSALDLVLRRSGVRLDRATAGEVVYAYSCWFRGRYVPHLVVQTSGGPVTVLVLRDEAVTREQRFEESGYTGLLLPVQGGTLAVLAREQSAIDAAALNEAAQRVLQAVDFDAPS